jgi:hypothetical protein
MPPQEPTINPLAATPAGAQPNSPQPQPQPTAQPSQNLDPQIVKLADSIAKTESGGNSKATGKSGEYGAYQWLPSTWDAESKAAGINVPLQQSTPEQQNQVWYNWADGLKKQGYTPAQIASMQNSGDPNAYLGTFEDGDPSEGTNGSGVQYNVPGYVSKVISSYDGQSGGSSQSNPLVSTANAASSASGNTQSSGQPDWLTALEGLGLGAGGWLLGQAGNYMKNAVPDVATDALVGGAAGSAVEPGGGTIIGGIGGAATGLVQAGIQTALQDAMGGGNNQQSNSSSQTSAQDQQSQTQPSFSEQELPNSVFASDAVKNAINETMQGTQANRVFSSSQAGRDAINTAAQFGLVEPDENGNLTYNSDKQRELESAIENGKDGIIASQEGSTNSPVAVSNYAGNYIGNDRLNTAADKEKAAKIIQEELRADSGGIPMNGQMSLSDMRKAQKTHHQAAKSSYNNPKPSADVLAHKAMAHAYGEAIKAKISEEDRPLYDKLTKMSADLTRSKELKKRVNGKKAPKKHGLWENFARQGARIAEAYIGDKLGGPIGAVIGATAGEWFNRKLDKKFGRNIFETKGMRAAMDILRDAKPKEYQNLIEALKKRGEKVPKDETKKPTSKEGLIKLIKKDESKMGRKGLVDLPNSGGARRGEREVKEGEVFSPGRKFRMDMNTHKNYVQE